MNGIWVATQVKAPKLFYLQKPLLKFQQGLYPTSHLKKDHQKLLVYFKSIAPKGVMVKPRGTSWRRTIHDAYWQQRIYRCWKSGEGQFWKTTYTGSWREAVFHLLNSWKRTGIKIIFHGLRAWQWQPAQPEWKNIISRTITKALKQYLYFHKFLLKTKRNKLPIIRKPRRMTRFLFFRTFHGAPPDACLSTGPGGQCSLKYFCIGWINVH